MRFRTRASSAVTAGSAQLGRLCMAVLRPLGATAKRIQWPHAVAACAIAYFAFPWILEAMERPAFDPQHKCPENAKRPDGRRDPKYQARPQRDHVFVIRLTNSGQFVDRCELTDAQFEMVGDRRESPRELRRNIPRWKAGEPDLPRLVLLYIHGWKHNDKSEDLDDFKRLVRELGDRHRPSKQVVGVYVAWNASWGLGPLDNLSFWSKQSTADRIAISASVSSIVSKLGSMRKLRNGTPDQLVAIGHSFGARLLFAATVQSLTYESARAHPGHSRGTYKVVRGATDAIVLLNPAFEASMYSALDGLRRDDEEFSAEQKPLLLAVASEADFATRVLFPIGQFLGGASREVERTAMGNYEDFFTHDLKDCTPPDGAISQPKKGLCLQRRVGAYRSQMFNPFIVARTTQGIIGDHNDVWNDRFRGWLGQFIQSLEQPPHSPSVSPTSDFQTDRIPE